MSENTSRTFHNSGATELVYDTEGHILAAGESVDVEKPVSDDRTQKLLASGKLVEIKQTHNVPARSQKDADKKERS